MCVCGKGVGQVLCEQVLAIRLEINWAFKNLEKTTSPRDRIVTSMKQ